MLQRMRHALGLCFCEAKGTDLTPLLIAPTVLHSAPKSLKPGSNFQILMDKLDGELPKKVRSDVAKARSARALALLSAAAGGDPICRLWLGSRGGLGAPEFGPRAGPQPLGCDEDCSAVITFHATATIRRGRSELKIKST